jgi:polar amino acid transport system substrate-binding protein
LRLLLLSLILVLALPATLSAEQAAIGNPPAVDSGPVIVPNFWDPRARIERPSASDIGTIKFLTTDDFPPFTFRDRRGILVGFDVDLANAICTVLKVECAIQVRPFATLVDGLRDGSGNAIIAGFDLEKASAEGLISSQAYLKIPGRFVVRRSAAFDLGAPSPAAKIGVLCGSAHAAYLARFFPDLHVTCFARPADGLDALQANKIDSVFADALSLSFWLSGPQSQECCRFQGGAFLDDRYFGAGLAVVMKSDNRQLKFAIDYALREVYRAGTYEELYLRYFPVGLF